MSTVLLVEDDDVDRMSVRRMLQGYELLEAPSIAEASAILASTRVHCALLDQGLPDGDGLDLMAQLAERGVPVVMLTGAGSEQLAVEALKSGCEDYLVKGDFTADTLNRTIANAMEKVSLRRQVQAQSRALERRAEALENINSELRQFASVAAHDLREPLNTIRSFCQFLSHRYGNEFDDTGRTMLSQMGSAANRMSALLASLLRYEAHEHKVQLVPVPLSDIVVEVVANLYDQIRRTGAQVTHGPLPTIAADPTMVIQLLQNLVSNALSHAEGVAPEVRIEAEEHRDEWLIRVMDNGPGIPVEMRERAFQPFQRLKRQTSESGSGLGLAICRRVVDLKDGRIWIEDAPGGGCAVHVALPRPIGWSDHGESPMKQPAQTSP